MSDIGYSEKDFEKYIVNLLVAKSGYIQGIISLRFRHGGDKITNLC